MYVVKAGGMTYPFKHRTASHAVAIVEEQAPDGEFIRVVDEAEWSTWPGGKPPPRVLKKPTLAEQPAPKKKAVSKKKPAPKKEANKPDAAIPDDDDSLENVDVSSI